MAYDNTNTGALFINDKKSDNHPDRQGSINVDGKEYWLSGWIKKTKKGDPYLSLAVKPKDKKDEPKPAAPLTMPHNNMDDEIPFN